VKRTALCLICCTFFLAGKIFAQREFHNWYFGSNTGISFSNGTPEPLNSSMIESVEGISSISDAAGNLLFYSNGLKIWNRDHEVMPNSLGIQGGLSSSQGTLIIPIPNSNKYYLFTVGAREDGVGDLRYNIIDMSLDNGKGDVEPGSKNVLLSTGNAEKMISATASNCGYWLITHQSMNAVFEARRITEAGIEPPVVSVTGSIHTYAVGTMKMSNDDLKIAVAVSATPGHVELFNFNNITGAVDNPIYLPLSSNGYSFGLCFSPDNRKLYVSEGFLGTDLYFYQFDLSTYTTAAIVGSKRFLGNTTCGTMTYSSSDMQLGPDGVIYFTRPWLTCLGMIPFPNAPAPDCGFLPDGLCLPNKVGICLPNSIRTKPKLLAFTLGPDTLFCPGSTLQLQAPNFTPHFLWSTGATTPSIGVQDEGKYWVQLGTGDCTASDTIEVKHLHTQVSLRADTAICPGNPLELGTKGFASYLWHSGETSDTITVSQPGLYWVEARDACGISTRDSVVVSKATFEASLGPDRNICPGDTTTITLLGTFTSYDWGPDYNIVKESGSSVSVAPSKDTAYYVQAEVRPGCFAYDTVRLTLTPAQQVSLGGDTAFCAGSVLRLEGGSGFTSYLWKDGSRGAYFETKQRGAVWVEVRDVNGCRSRDTINTSWLPCGQELWMPTAFTPNGDGKNDLFRPGYKGMFESYQLTVYNRWGGVVFKSGNPDAGWNGSTFDTGVFVWVCRYQLFGDVPRVKTGTVTLIR